MGLLKLKNNYYIRLTLDGTYYVYKSKKERDIEKKATHPEVIKQKYSEIIHELKQDAEGLYYLGTSQLLQDWQQEFQAYLNKDTSHKFPLMKAYIKDVAKTIRSFVDAGKIRVQGNTLREVYDYVKQYKVFGETEDDL